VRDGARQRFCAPVAAQATGEARLKQSNRDLIRIKHVAEKMDVCERTVRRYLKQGLLEGVHIGGLHLVKYDSYERLIGLNNAAA
jgi:hypothetical protein